MKKIILVVPVYNEQAVLEKSIRKLHNYLSKNIKQEWIIIIANNASTDDTKRIADMLAKGLKRVKAVHLKFKGRGNALRYVWSNYKADIYAYCDVDLATNINHIKELLDNAQINNIVTGSRYLKTAKSKRSFKRLFLSKSYNLLVRLFFKTKINDFQCGFKAIDKKTSKYILPKTKNKGWFFDTELLLIAEKNKYKVKEIPVEWKESKDTKIEMFRIIFNYIKNLVRLKNKLTK